MTFDAELRRELARRGLASRRIRRILAELEDHRACDLAAQLGAPALIAERFAAELCVSETRRATYEGFSALAAAGLLLLTSTLSVSVAGGWPSVSGVRAAVAVLAALAIVLAGQVSFVGGVLALWLHFGGTGELRLVQRRLRLGLVAGTIAVAGEGSLAIALAPGLPGWWFALAVGASLVSAAALAAAAVALRRAGALTPVARPAAVGIPRWFVLATGLLAVAAMTSATGHAERSLLEGVERGAFEGLAFAGGFLVLGRFLGLRPPVRHETVPTLRQ